MENGGWRQHKYTAWLESLVGNYIWQFDGQVKIRQYFLITYTIHVRMAIPYRAAKFRSTNAIAIAILGPTTEFDSRQIFRLCCITVYVCASYAPLLLPAFISR